MYYGTLPGTDALSPRTPPPEETALPCGHPFPRASHGASLSPKALQTSSHLSHLRDKQSAMSSLWNGHNRERRNFLVLNAVTTHRVKKSAYQSLIPRDLIQKLLVDQPHAAERNEPAAGR